MLFIFVRKSPLRTRKSPEIWLDPGLKRLGGTGNNPIETN
jgi:hypothetical protein